MKKKKVLTTSQIAIQGIDMDNPNMSSSISSLLLSDKDSLSLNESVINQ